jgi:hypothetical protein
MWVAGAILAEARAESWCAAPLVAHEWGVVRLRGDGAPVGPGLGLPAWMARAEVARSGGPRVRDLPSDGGERDLPVISLYTTDSWSFPVPFALDVGFSAGAPSAWWPPADSLSTAGVSWGALALTREGTPSREATVPWVTALRALPGALWVTAGRESERFVFYEGRTAESSALVLRRGDSFGPGRPHYVLENVSDDDVFDVVITLGGHAWTAPAIPAHKSAGFMLDGTLSRDDVRATLRSAWAGGGPPTTGWGPGCVMMRDPAVPVTTTVDHVLYPAEVDVLFAAWDGTLFRPEPGAAQLVYRESTNSLDRAVPAALYTDMYHYVDWHRLSVVVVDGVKP